MFNGIWKSMKNVPSGIPIHLPNNFSVSPVHKRINESKIGHASEKRCHCVTGNYYYERGLVQ